MGGRDRGHVEVGAEGMGEVGAEGLVGGGRVEADGMGGLEGGSSGSLVTCGCGRRVEYREHVDSAVYGKAGKTRR